MTKFRVGVEGLRPGMMGGRRVPPESLKRVHIIEADNHYHAKQKYARKYRGNKSDTALIVAHKVKTEKRRKKY